MVWFPWIRGAREFGGLEEAGIMPTIARQIKPA